MKYDGIDLPKALTELSTMAGGLEISERSFKRYLELNDRTLDEYDVVTDQQFAERPLRDAMGLSVFDTAPLFNEVSTGFIPQLDVAGFTADLDATLESDVAGYFWQMRQDNKPIAAGAKQWARFPADGSVSWNRRTDMHVASISKFLTALIVVRAMTARGLDIASTRIADFLPQYWQQGPSVDQITVAQLLQHRSGFSSAGAGFSSAGTRFADGKQAVANGPVLTVGNYRYDNVNYSILRVLFATLNEDLPKSLGFLDSDAFWDWLTISAYVQGMRRIVFDPAGLEGVISDNDPNGALAYDAAVTATGRNFGDLALHLGPIGWYLSAGQLLDVADLFMKGGIVGQPSSMFTNRYGFEDGAVLMRALWRSPAIYVGGSWTTRLMTPSSTITQGVRSNLWFLHNRITLVVYINSPIATAPIGIDDRIWAAYLANSAVA